MGLNVNGGVDYDHLVQLNRDLLKNKADRKNWLANLAECLEDTSIEKKQYKSLDGIHKEEQAILAEIAHCIQVLDEAD